MAVRRTITSAAPFASSSMGYLDSHPLFLYTTYRAIPIFVRVKNCTAQAPARHRISRIVADIYAAFFIIIFPFTFNKRWLNQDATLIFISLYFFALSVDSSPTVGCKEYPDVKTAADSIVKVTETIEPDGELTEKYEKQYSKFRQMYPALKAVFQNLGE